MVKIVLNSGCGHDLYGTDRIDFRKSEETTLVHDLNKPLPFPNNYYDEIRSWSVLEHIKDLRTYISECKRVLKDGGKLDLVTDFAGYILLYIKNDHNECGKDDPNAIFYRHPDDHHYHLFVESHLKYLLKGFDIIETSYPKANRKWFMKWKNVIRYLPFKLGYEDIRIIAVKNGN